MVRGRTPMTTSSMRPVRGAAAAIAVAALLVPWLALESTLNAALVEAFSATGKVNVPLSLSETFAIVNAALSSFKIVPVALAGAPTM